MIFEYPLMSRESGRHPRPRRVRKVHARRTPWRHQGNPRDRAGQNLLAAWACRDGSRSVDQYSAAARPARCRDHGREFRSLRCGRGQIAHRGYDHILGFLADSVCLEGLRPITRTNGLLGLVVLIPLSKSSVSEADDLGICSSSASLRAPEPQGGCPISSRRHAQTLKTEAIGPSRSFAASATRRIAPRRLKTYNF
jgi:hypothetical protein